MALTTPTSPQAWRPDQYEFAPKDVLPQALILQCSSVVGKIEGDEPVVRVAFVDDAEAEFTPEGTPIPESDPTLGEVLVSTGKITQLVRLSREQWSQPGTAEQLSASVSRALTKRANAAFVAEPANASSPGLINVAGIVSGGAVSDSLDVLIDLVAQLEDNDATPTHILMDPMGWAAFRKFKTGEAYNSNLLGAGTSDAEQRLLSLPVRVDKALPDYTGLVVDKNAVVSAVGSVMVADSEHALFGSDEILLRALWRIGWNVVRPSRIGVFTIGEGS